MLLESVLIYESQYTGIYDLIRFQVETGDDVLTVFPPEFLDDVCLGIEAGGQKEAGKE